VSNSGSHSIDLSVPAPEVWKVLVASGRRDWYYRLAPKGDFEPGSQILWLDLDGEVVEETEVVEVESERRLVLRTHFVFAPNFAGAPPHEVTWEVSGSAGGSQVRMSWKAEEPAHHMMENQGGAQLQGLRLAVDPSARAQLERLPEIGEVVVRDVTPDLVAEYQHFFDDIAFRDFPNWQDCYCFEPHRTQSDEEADMRTAAANRHDMSASIQHGTLTALLAFADQQPVGWCNYGETTQLAGVMRRFNLEPADQNGVGSVACFVIAAPYRGHGVASKLLDAAIERLRARGMRAIEAYPSRGGHDSPQSNFRGPLSMYVRAGFEPYREMVKYVVMRKRLA
jgi:GNAT superfamily N-acetyltransferase